MYVVSNLQLIHLQLTTIMTLQDLINLTKDDNGKVFVVDLEGNVKLVMLNVEEYQRLLLGKLKQQVRDIEAVNEEIIKAQLQEEPTMPEVPTPLSQTLNKRAQELFKSRKGPASFQQDLRSEVIDPSFDFEAPRLELEDI